MRQLVLIMLALPGLWAGAQGLSLSNAWPGVGPGLQGLLRSNAVPGVAGAPAVAPSNALPSVGDLLSATNLGSMANLAAYVPDDKYKMRVGDKISYQVVEDKGLPTTLTVADSGELEVPLVGRVMALDKTCKQVADGITKLLGVIYKRATVIVALEAANQILGRVYVVGQVRGVGALEIKVNENITAAKAILRAGGLGDYADKKGVMVVRPPKTPGGTNRVFVLNMKDILEKGKLEKDIPLEPDDFVIVPASIISF
jgi:polysaccharide biosynthesis/export protein